MYGTYRGNTVILNYNPENGLVEIQTLDGDFVSCWRMSSKQLINVSQRGSLRGWCTMREYQPGSVEDGWPYARLAQSFVNEELSAEQFEDRYLDLFRSDDKNLPDSVADPIHEIFYDIDEYVSDPALRVKASG